MKRVNEGKTTLETKMTFSCSFINIFFVAAAVVFAYHCFGHHLQVDDDYYRKTREE